MDYPREENGIRVYCPQEGHEAMEVYDIEDEPDELDSVTHRVRILSPQEAIDANGQDEQCCSGCAAKLAGAYIGFGWDVEVRDLKNIDN